MDTKPMFIESTEVLLSSLRLSGLEDKPDGDANSLVEQAIQSSVVRFYSELTVDRIGEIKAVQYVPNPSTVDQSVRLLANLTEQRLVKLDLMATMPHRFLDGGGSVRQDWNEEAPLLDDSEERAIQRRRLEKQIADAFPVLAGDTALTDNPSKKIRASTLGPANSKYTGPTNVYPGGTVFPPGAGSGTYPPGDFE